MITRNILRTENMGVVDLVAELRLENQISRFLVFRNCHARVMQNGMVEVVGENFRVDHLGEPAA